MLWFWLHIVLIKGNKQTNTEYNMNYIKVIWVIKREFTTLCELEKIFHAFSNSIDCENLIHGEMKFKKSFKSYSKYQWLYCR